LWIFFPIPAIAVERVCFEEAERLFPQLGASVVFLLSGSSACSSSFCFFFLKKRRSELTGTLGLILLREWTRL
jgi:hypothetical protein